MSYSRWGESTYYTYYGVDDLFWVHPEGGDYIFSLTAEEVKELLATPLGEHKIDAHAKNPWDAEDLRRYASLFLADYRTFEVEQSTGM